MELPSNPHPLASPLAAGKRGNLREVRASGWVLTAVGVIVSTSMAVRLHSFTAKSPYLFRGSEADSREFTRSLGGLYGSVFLFGLVCLATGVYQVRTAARSRLLNTLLLLVAVGIVYFAWRIASTCV